MPLSFLNPTLLLGTLAAALPVIIHFLSRRRIRRQMFSDLRFLDEVQARQARSLGIRRWLLLLLRVLILLLVALAAAGPRWGGLGTAGGARSLLLVIDNSASMNTQQEEGTRLDTALAAAADMIAALPGEASIQVVVAGSRTAAVFGDWLPAGAGAVGGLGRVGPTDGTFDLPAVLREAARQVARAPGQPVDVAILSDFQDPGSGADHLTAAERLVSAGATRFLLRQVGEPTISGGITAVELPRRALQPGESVTLTGQVRTEHANQVVVLELDGAPVAEAVVPQAGGPTPVEFSLTVPAAGIHRGRVWKNSDAFPGDDSRPFVLSVPPTIRVLLVHGADRPVDSVAGRGGWRFVTEALAPGAGPSPFRVQTASSDDMQAGDLNAVDVLVLFDPGPLGRRVLDGFGRWLNEGGSVLVMTGDPGQSANLRDNLLPVMNMTPQAEFQVSEGAGQHPRILAADHPVFAGLDPEALATLSDVAWRRWFALDGSTGTVLVELSGGDPLVMVSTVGEGRAAVLPWNALADGSDLVDSPMALPFYQRIVAWLAAPAGAGSARNTAVGQAAVIVPAVQDGSPELGRIEDISVAGPQSGDAGVSTGVELEWRGGRSRLSAGVIDHAGFYTYLAGFDTLGVIAAAVPAEETVREILTGPQWRDHLESLDLTVAGDLSGSLPASFLDVLGGRSLAPWLLGLAICLLMLELAVGRGAGRSNPAD